MSFLLDHNSFQPYPKIFCACALVIERPSWYLRGFTKNTDLIGNTRKSISGSLRESQVCHPNWIAQMKMTKCYAVTLKDHNDADKDDTYNCRDNDDDRGKEKGDDCRDDEEYVDKDESDEFHDNYQDNYEDSLEYDDDDDKGKLLHFLVDMESGEENLASARDGDQSNGGIRNDSVASYDAKLTQEQANLHVAEQSPHVCAAAANEQWDD